MGIQEDRFVRGFVCYLALGVVIFTIGVVESNLENEESLLDYLVGSGEISEEMADILRINCRLELLHAKKSLQDLAKSTNSEALSNGRLSSKRMHGLDSVYLLQVKQILVGCLREKVIVPPTTGEDQEDSSIWYTKYIRFLFSWPSPSRRRELAQTPGEALAQSPTSSPSPAPPVRIAPSPPLLPFFPPDLIGPRSGKDSSATVSNIQSSKHDTATRTIVIAVVVTAFLTFTIAALLFFCFRKYCKRGFGQGRNDERPLLSLSLTSSHKSFSVELNEERLGNQSFNKLNHNKISGKSYVESHSLSSSKIEIPVRNDSSAATNSVENVMQLPGLPTLKLPPGRVAPPKPQAPVSPPSPPIRLSSDGPRPPPPGPPPPPIPSAVKAGPRPPPLPGGGPRPPPPPGDGPRPPPPPVGGPRPPPPPAGGPRPPPPPAGGPRPPSAPGGGPRPPPAPGSGPRPPPPPSGGGPRPPPPPPGRGPRPPPPPGGGPRPPPPPGGGPRAPPPPGGGPRAPPPPMGSKPPRSLPNSASTEEWGAGESKAKLKPFFWDKVLANPDSSMVWHQIKSGSFQFNEEMIESLFGFAPTTNNKNETKKEEPANQFIKIIDQKKAQNLSIMLKALNVTTEEVCDALDEGNELPSELIQTLLKMAPTTEEELKLRLFDGQLSQLGTAERFLKVLVDVPFAFKRMESLLFMCTIEEDLLMLKESFTVLEDACKELRKSRLFLKLLEAVLKTGNRMNDGTFRGGAQAFKLDTLLKLSDVKGVDGKTTLLHFVVQEIIRSEGIRAARAAKESASLSSLKSVDLSEEAPLEDSEEVLRELGLQVISGLGSELQNVRKAAVLDSDSVTGTVVKLRHNLTKSRTFLNSDMKSVDENNGFHLALKSFVQHAEADVKWSSEEEKRIFGLVKSTRDYFHGNAAKEEGLRLFIIVRDFLVILEKVCREVKMAPRKPPNLTQKKEEPVAAATSADPRQTSERDQKLPDKRMDHSSSIG